MKNVQTFTDLIEESRRITEKEKQDHGASGFKKAFFAGEYRALDIAGTALAEAALICSALGLTPDEVIQKFNELTVGTDAGARMRKEKTQNTHRQKLQNFLMS